MLAQPLGECPLGTCPSQIPELGPGIQDMWPDVDLYHMAPPGAAGKTPPRIYDLGLGKEEYIEKKRLLGKPHPEFMTWDWGRRNT